MIWRFQGLVDTNPSGVEVLFEAAELAWRWWRTFDGGKGKKDQGRKPGRTGTSMQVAGDGRQSRGVLVLSLVIRYLTGSCCSHEQPGGS